MNDEGKVVTIGLHNKPGPFQKSLLKLLDFLNRISIP